MNFQSVTCRHSGYEVELHRTSSLKASIKDVYPHITQPQLSKMIQAMKYLNPTHSFYIRDENSMLPMGSKFFLPPKARLDSFNPSQQPMPSVNTSQIRQTISEIKAHVDSIEELKGSGIEIQFPQTEPLVIRRPEKKSDLETWVRIVIPIPAREKARTWWQKWKGTVISCGAAGTGVVATAFTCGGTPFTAGGLAPLCVASVLGTTASAGQCGLAYAKASNPEFEYFLETEDGQWINYVDIGLDFFSLGIGVASLPNAFNAASKAYKATKYTKYLKHVNKGKLVKTMTKIEQMFSQMRELKNMFEAGLKMANPAGKQVLTNNIVKRMLPKVIKQLTRDKIQNLSALISTSLSTAGSHYGGVGSEGWGIVKNVELEVYQFLEMRGDK